jgi:glycosyltransferase involved in cell wall biosynthesis
MSPLVSICIPAFNAEATLASCLRSVLIQDVPDTEIILVDNCSTDRTVELAREILGDHPRARIIRNSTNVGRIGNWNRCLEEAKGNYIKFAFTNDALLPGAVQALVRAMEAHPDTVIGGSQQKTVSAMPQVMPVVPADVKIHLRSNADSLEYLARNGFASLGSLNGMIYRRSAIENSGLRFRDDIPYFADYVHALELASTGMTAYLDTETYLFNEGATGRYHFAGLKSIPKFLEEHRICTRRHMELLKLHGRPGEAALDYLWGRYFWYLGQGWSISPRDGWRTFRGSPSHQLKAAAKTAWFLMRQRAGSS